MSDEPEVEEVEPCPYLAQMADGESEHMPISAATMARMLHVQDANKRCMMCDGLIHWARHKIDHSEGDRKEAFLDMLSELVGQ